MIDCEERSQKRRSRHPETTVDWYEIQFSNQTLFLAIVLTVGYHYPYPLLVLAHEIDSHRFSWHTA